MIIIVKNAGVALTLQLLEESNKSFHHLRKLTKNKIRRKISQRFAYNVNKVTGIGDQL